MGELARLWNPRCNNRLRRHWVAYEDRIVIGGEGLHQAGVLSVRPGRHGELRARLRVMGRAFEEAISHGHDIAVWINGLELYVGVTAIDAGRMLLVFGIPPGTKVSVTLEAGPAIEDGTEAHAAASDGAGRFDGPCAIGLRQTRC